MGETREVPVLTFAGSFFTDPDQFMNDFIDAIDAAVKLNPLLENLSDMLKQTLKQEGVKVLVEKVHGPLTTKTITCEK